MIVMVSVYMHVEAELEAKRSPPQRHVLRVVQPRPHIPPHKLQRCTYLLKPLLNSHAKGLTLQ